MTAIPQFEIAEIHQEVHHSDGYSYRLSTPRRLRRFVITVYFDGYGPRPPKPWQRGRVYLSDTVFKNRRIAKTAMRERALIWKKTNKVPNDWHPCDTQPRDIQ